MFGPGFIQRVMFTFVLCTMLSLLLDGLWLGATDYGTLKSLTWFTSYGYSSYLIPFIAFGSFLLALPHMLVWDYSFFTSLGAFGGIMRVFLSVTLSVGFVWGFATMLWPLIAQVFVAVVRGISGAIGRFFGGI